MNELKEVEVEKLGLVTNGANQETFFLLKSADAATVSIENATATVSQPDQQEVQKEDLAGQVEKSVWQRITALFKQALEPEHQPEVLAELGVEKAECATASDPEEEDDEEEDAPVMKQESILEVPPMSDVEMVAKAQYDLLANSVTDLQTRLAKAEAIAESARDTSALQAAIVKAGELVALPINATDLGTNLHKLAKADPELAKYFEAVLKASDKLLLDLGIYGERGTSNVAETTDPILKAAQSADPRAALLALSPREANEYLAKRQAATAGRRM